jgi:hypothetical protein
LKGKKLAVLQHLIKSSLSDTDFALLAAICNILNHSDEMPTASRIQEEMTSVRPLKKTQLYRCLKYLRDLGLVRAGLVLSPRHYIVDDRTILFGAEQWLHHQRSVFRKKADDISSILSVLERVSPEEIASVINAELSQYLSKYIPE